MEHRVVNGIRAYNAGRYDDAVEHFRTVIEYAKWIEPSAKIDALLQRAKEVLALTRGK